MYRALGGCLKIVVSPVRVRVSPYVAGLEPPVRVRVSPYVAGLEPPVRVRVSPHRVGGGRVLACDRGPPYGREGASGPRGMARVRQCRLAPEAISTVAG